MVGIFILAGATILGAVLGPLIARREPKPHRRRRLWLVAAGGGLIGIGAGIVLVLFLALSGPVRSPGPTPSPNAVSQFKLVFSRPNGTIRSASLSQDAKWVALGTDAAGALLVNTDTLSTTSLQGITPNDGETTSISSEGDYVYYTGLIPEPAAGRAYNEAVLYDRVHDQYLNADCAADAPPTGIGDSAIIQGVSTDAQTVIFSSDRPNLVVDVAPASPGELPIYAVDRRSCLASVAVPIAASGAGSCGCELAILSSNGQAVAFATDDALLPDDTNGALDVYLRSLSNGLIRRASLRSDGSQFTMDSTVDDVSNDGRYVLFEAPDGGPVTNAGTPPTQLFLRDMDEQTTFSITRRPDGGIPDDSSGPGRLSGSGSDVAFTSDATDLIQGADVFGVYRWNILTRSLSATNYSEFANGLGTHVYGLSADGTRILVGVDQSAEADGPQELVLIEN